MKDSAAKPSVFATLARLISRNWGLKLLALALAILLYYALKPTDSEGSTYRPNRLSGAAVAPATPHAAKK